MKGREKGTIPVQLPALAPEADAAGSVGTATVGSTVAGCGRAPLVLGECVQGRRDDGLDFLITAPIYRFSTARFTWGCEAQGLTVEPADYVKSFRAVRQWLTEQGLPVGGRLEVHTDLPLRQGFGTSTADIAASLRAAADAWRRPMPPEEVSRIAIGIEPTDGSMYPDSVAYAHRCGRLLEKLGPLPRFTALVICDGEGVDTLEFEKWRLSEQGPKYSREEMRQFGDAWQMVRHAVRTHDVSLLGQACLISAQVNERILPKAFFGQVYDLFRQGVGEGLITAHSGSAIALMLNPDAPSYRQQRARALEHLNSCTGDGWLELANFPPPQPVEEEGGQEECWALSSSVSSMVRRTSGAK